MWPSLTCLHYTCYTKSADFTNFYIFKKSQKIHITGGERGASPPPPPPNEPNQASKAVKPNLYKGGARNTEMNLLHVATLTPAVRELETMYNTNRKTLRVRDKMWQILSRIFLSNFGERTHISELGPSLCHTQF